MTDGIERWDSLMFASIGCRKDGDYVRHSDHLAAMQAKDAEIAELLKDVTFLQSGKDVIHDELRAELKRLTRDHEFEAWSHRCQRERDAAVKRAEKAEAALETACERAAKYHDILTEKREYAAGWDAALAARDKAKDDRIAELEAVVRLRDGTIKSLMIQIRAQLPASVGGDTRPKNCRFRLQDEGKAYPKSSCQACGKGVFTGLGNSCAQIGGQS